MSRIMLICNFFIFLLFPLSVFSRDSTFTFVLKAGKMECFYEYIHEGALLEVEYQVISGGELDINFFITGPDGSIITSDDRKMDSLHSVDVKATGEYTVCLDNSFSHLTEKMVFIDIIIDDDSGEEKPQPAESVPDLVKKMEIDMKLQNLTQVLTNMTIHLNHVVREQHFFRARESRHRHTLMGNNSRVQWWSLGNCLAVVSVGIMQVFLVRNLFKTQRTDKIRT